MRTVRDIPRLENIPVLVRVAMNVPIENGKVVNDYRLRRAIPTIRFLSEHGARVVLISHIGEMGTETLSPVAEALGKLIPRVSFSPETVGALARDAVRNLNSGDILVLENLRRNSGEISNSPDFARELSLLADVFVQDSFDTCHRTHASIIGVPKLLPSYAGLLLEEEARELSLALSPKHPSLAVVGGSKFSTKEEVLSTLLNKYDRVFVGGALASDFLLAEGLAVGKSLVGGADIEQIKRLQRDKKLLLPIDVRVISANIKEKERHSAHARVASVSDIKPDEMIIDHGPSTSALLAELAKTSKTVLWNGPLGNYENGFTEGTDDFARAISISGARSVVGGGDTVAAIENLGLLSKFSFVSTGGGAMLDFLAKGSLPGIDALD